MQQIGCHIREHAVGGLRIDEVLRELGGEWRDIEVVAAGAPEDAGVAGPAEPLIALRAVRRDADEVAALAPDAERPHAIHEVLEVSGRPVGLLSRLLRTLPVRVASVGVPGSPETWT